MISLIGRPYCQKVLPLVYDESLSYLEQICKLRYKINEVIDEFNNWENIILELQEALQDIDGVKSDIEVLKGDIVTINTRLSELGTAVESVNKYAKSLEVRISNNEEAINNIIQMIANFNTNVDKKLDALEKKLTDMINSITIDFKDELTMLQLKVNQMKVNLQSQIDELKARVDNIDTTVLNPWHYKLGKVSQQRNTVLTYNDLADEVPTATEYNKLGLNASDYSSRGLSAIDYARRGKEKLHYYWVCSPAYGWWQEINNVLTSIVNYCSNTINANQYTAYDLTADEYSDLDMSAQEYYKFSINKLGVYLEGNVLQSNQFSFSVTDYVGSIDGVTSEYDDGVVSFVEI